MAYVYWIHLPEHTNVCDGYIGVFKGKNIKERWNRHKRDAALGSNYIIHKVIRKYDNLVYDVLFTGEYEGCLQLEAYWRPNLHIGWNIHAGGRSCSPMQGRVHTEESKIKMKSSHTSKKRSVESLIKQSNTLKGHTTSEETKRKISTSQKGKANNGVLKRRKVVKASTGEIFESVSAAARWVGIHSSSIFKHIKGEYSSAGTHPETKEKLQWQYLYSKE